ncbi:uncharacterized protein EKO05_0002691 [Ascochyta rabiei]|uniref:Uncharacterized protein n=1 Tax=Didymella rabiei TaxID=5454 RepID=A0A163GP62_DIDRA|nr:uncharacterized protein EKO05_0002691 [Ascochyta rabiei]KZM24944.1 hypothetical protein ST47_g3940 [Ascochyta rabiei]UPX12120.1 hypothetical protein EKO05_0002691 [Ascochyta rabiei]
MPISAEHAPKAAFFRATSLCAVRGLQLTRVPWLDRLGFQASHHITAMLRPFTAGTFSHAETYNMVTNALYLGNSPSYSDDLRLFVVFPRLEADIRNNSRLLACFWQKCMLPAIDAIHSPHRLSEQNCDGMDYISHVPKDEMEFLDESLATFGLHTPNQRHDSAQLLSLDQAWEGIEQTAASHEDLQSLRDTFLIVSWEAPAVSVGMWEAASFERFLNPDFIDQRCGKVVYEKMREERPALQTHMRTVSRKRSATLTQLEEKPDPKRTQSMDMN